MAAGTTNITTEFYERPYYAAREQVPPDDNFRHTPPALPGSPPAYPEELNSAERAEVERYTLFPSDATLATLTLRLAIAKANEYKTYYATPDYMAWKDADRAARIVQFRKYMGDAFVYNKATTAKSADAAGAGASPPIADMPPVNDVPG